MKTRKLYFDIAKIIAAYSIIILHFEGEVRYRLESGIDSKMFATILYDSITRWAVPVFVMISGALFLRMNCTLKTIIKKYILRLIALYIVFSLVFALYDSSTLDRFIKCILEPKYHLWFIPMITMLYLCVPIIKKIVEDRKILMYFLTLSLIFIFCYITAKCLVNDFFRDSIKNIANPLFDRVGDLSIGAFLGFVFYFVLGYLLDNIEISSKIRRWIYVSGIIGIVLMIILDWLVPYRTGVVFLNYCDEIRLTTLAYSVAMFVLIKYLYLKFSKNSSRDLSLVTTISNLTLGVYLIHPLFIDIYFDNIYKGASNTFEVMWIIPVVSAVIFIISILVTWIVSSMKKAIMLCISRK